MSETPPPSVEILTEEFYDAAAWLRDLELEFPVRVEAVTLTLGFPTTAQILDPETQEIETVDAIYEARLTRFPDGLLHVHGPGVCADIDPDLLREKRP